MFKQLAGEKVISRELANKMGKAYGFRNLIVHDYDRIDFELIAKSHDENIQNLKNFLRAMMEYLESKL